ncbi:MAG: GNAT family N-acetyltransferase [Bacteroidota bacterium]
MLETERLYLRKIETSDDVAMFELDSNPEVCTYLGNKPVKDMEEIRSIIQMIHKQYEENGIGRWAVIEKASNNFIGWSGLKLVKEPINNQVNFYDLGYRFMPRYWNKGYASEAAKAWIDFAFNEL